MSELYAEQRMKIYKKMSKGKLETWLYTNSPEITDEECEKVYIILLREFRNDETAEMWDMLRQAKKSADLRVKLSAEIIKVLGRGSVQLPMNHNEILAFGSDDSDGIITQTVIEKAYKALNEHLQPMRSEFDVEINKAINEKPASNMTLNERYRISCSLM